MRRVEMMVAAAVVAGCLQVSAQVPQPFPGRQNQPRPTPPPPTTQTPAPPPATSTPPPSSAPDSAPSEATLGFPVYPSAQFITSYDAGRGQTYYLFGSEMPFAALVKYLPERAKNARHSGLRRAGDAYLRGRTLPRGDDGVSAGGDNQGLHVERERRISESQEKRTASPLPIHHPDCSCAYGRSALT